MVSIKNVNKFWKTHEKLCKLKGKVAKNSSNILKILDIFSTIQKFWLDWRNGDSFINKKL